MEGGSQSDMGEPNVADGSPGRDRDHRVLVAQLKAPAGCLHRRPPKDGAREDGVSNECLTSCQLHGCGRSRGRRLATRNQCSCGIGLHARPFAAKCLHHAGRLQP